MMKQCGIHEIIALAAFSCTLLIGCGEQPVDSIQLIEKESLATGENLEPFINANCEYDQFYSTQDGRCKNAREQHILSDIKTEHLLKRGLWAPLRDPYVYIEEEHDQKAYSRSIMDADQTTKAIAYTFNMECRNWRRSTGCVKEFFGALTITRDGKNWTFETAPFESDYGSQFGNGIAVEDDLVAVIGFLNSYDNLYLYQFDGRKWVEHSVNSVNRFIRDVKIVNDHVLVRTETGINSYHVTPDGIELDIEISIPDFDVATQMKYGNGLLTTCGSVKCVSFRITFSNESEVLEDDNGETNNNDMTWTRLEDIEINDVQQHVCLFATDGNRVATIEGDTLHLYKYSGNIPQHVTQKSVPIPQGISDSNNSRFRYMGGSLAIKDDRIVLGTPQEGACSRGAAQNHCKNNGALHQFKIEQNTLKHVGWFIGQENEISGLGGSVVLVDNQILSTVKKQRTHMRWSHLIITSDP